jgi:circadian clock protein KaiC
MSDTGSLGFEVVPTGVANLDVVLGGGIPAGSFNLVAGGPGTGKTILSHEIMFKTATPERQALHFTVLGEPVTKLLRYQSRFSFFDPSKVGTAIRYVDIGDVVRKEGLERGLEVIIARVERHSPSLVIVDSVRAVREIARREGEYGLRTFTHDLSQVAVVWNTTSLMIGEFDPQELGAGPEFTMADGILWLEMAQNDNSVIRKLQAVKSRGMNLVQGLHAFRISSSGIYVYPRVSPEAGYTAPPAGQRLGFGIPHLDRMMSGGIPQAETCLIAGSSGTGKSILAQQYLADGLARGERCVAVTFEESPGDYIARAEAIGLPLRRAIDSGELTLIYYPPHDLTVDQVIDEIRHAVDRTGARRLVVDSISGLEIARSPADKSSFREAIFRMVAWFRAQQVTAVLTAEVPGVLGDPRLSNLEISFVADNVVLLRFIEIESELRRFLGVIKMRRSAHDRELRGFTITDRGVVVGAPFREYTGLLSGTPSLVSVMGPQPFAPGLDARETALVAAIFGLGTATADEIVAETGFNPADVDRMVADLVGRGFLVRTQAGDRTLYHVSMVSWVPGVRRPPRGPGARPPEADNVG